MARIFTAIRFDDEFKRELVALQNALKGREVRGDYCSYGNLHMTLSFNYENMHLLPKIRQAVSEIQFEPFTMTLDRLGMFPTKDGVIWAGVKETEPVTTIANKLRERLDVYDIPYSPKPFYPHISLLRHPSEIITDIYVPQATVCVERINVMKSERIDGKLVYSEI